MPLANQRQGYHHRHLRICTKPVGHCLKNEATILREASQHIALSLRRYVANGDLLGQYPDIVHKSGDQIHELIWFSSLKKCTLLADFF